MNVFVPLRLVLYSAQETHVDQQVDQIMRQLLPDKAPRVGFVPTTPDDDGSWYQAKVTTVVPGPAFLR